MTAVRQTDGITARSMLMGMRPTLSVPSMGVGRKPTSLNGDNKVLFGNCGMTIEG